MLHKGALPYVLFLTKGHMHVKDIDRYLRKMVDANKVIAQVLVDVSEKYFIEDKWSIVP